MIKAWHYLVYLDHWLGSLLLPFVAVIAIVFCARRARRHYWLKGAAIAAVVHALSLAGFIAFDLLFWKQDNSWVPITPTEQFQAASTLPIGALLDSWTGREYVVEMRYLNLTAFGSWTIIGAVVGLLVHIFRNMSAWSRRRVSSQKTGGIAPPPHAAD